MQTSLKELGIDLVALSGPDTVGVTVVVDVEDATTRGWTSSPQT
jgi:hypothetical protein